MFGMVCVAARWALKRTVVSPFLEQISIYFYTHNKALIRIGSKFRILGSEDMKISLLHFVGCQLPKYTR